MNLDTIKQAINLLLKQPKVEREESRQKMSDIIEKLNFKKMRLKEKLQELGEHDETSDRYVEVEQEYQVVSKLLKKAKLSYSEIQQPSEQQDNNS